MNDWRPIKPVHSVSPALTHIFTDGSLPRVYIDPCTTSERLVILSNQCTWTDWVSPWIDIAFVDFVDVIEIVRLFLL
jgi:hypothetical protein